MTLGNMRKVTCQVWRAWSAHRRAAELERAANAAEPDGEAMALAHALLPTRPDLMAVPGDPKGLIIHERICPF